MRGADVSTVFADTTRRKLEGPVTFSHGFVATASGNAHLLFEQSLVTISLLHAGKTYWVPYNAVSNLEVGKPHLVGAPGSGIHLAWHMEGSKRLALWIDFVRLTPDVLQALLRPVIATFE